MWNWIGQQLLPFVVVLRAHHRLRQQARVLESVDFEMGDSATAGERLLKEVQSQYAADIERIRTVEGKAQSGLFVVALSVTFLLGSLDFMAQHGDGILRWSTFLLIAGIVYLVVAAVLCLKALHTTQIHGVTPFWDEDGKIVSSENSSDVMTPALYKALQQNRVTVTMKCNLNDAMLVCIRNGIALLAVFLTVVMLSRFSVGARPPQPAKTVRQPALLWDTPTRFSHPDSVPWLQDSTASRDSHPIR